MPHGYADHVDGGGVARVTVSLLRLGRARRRRSVRNSQGVDVRTSPRGYPMRWDLQELTLPLSEARLWSCAQSVLSGHDMRQSSGRWRQCRSGRYVPAFR